MKVVAGIVFCLSCMLYATYAPFRNTVNDRVADFRARAKGLLEAHYSPTRPSKTTAYGATKGHGPRNAVDLNTASFWAVPFDTQADKKKAILMVEFDHIVSLDQLIVTAGGGDAFTEHGRPRQILLTFTNEERVRLQLQDTTKPQKFSLRSAVGIKTVKIEITDVYASDNGKDVTIAELEFFSLL
ncbi:NADase-type glycan-binding domain-containing protein [Streptomyces sp. NPDC019539]|uniref:NADase-type glycan-binding domain-containing protein n=1 Tax=Streptomyces sp. NPDC019539 TaxID=3365063 RepID=UPI0037AFF2F4